MTKYILLQPDEDGNPVSWLDDSELEDINQLKEDYGIKRFLDEIPNNPDPNYWEDGDAMLLKAEICKVKPKQIVEKYVIEGDGEDEDE